jgi:hypothetical protein
MKNLIELLSDSGVTFDTKNIVRLVKSIDVDFQTAAVEVLLGKQCYTPFCEYIEMKGKKCKFKSHNPLRDRVEYSYMEQKHCRVTVPKTFVVEDREETKIMEACKDKADVFEFAKHLFVDAEEEGKDITIYYGEWSKEYNSHLKFERWLEWENNYKKKLSIQIEEDIF